MPFAVFAVATKIPIINILDFFIAQVVANGKKENKNEVS
jgi:hypothetical protein